MGLLIWVAGFVCHRACLSSASSLSSGEGDTDLDFASVQRENPEMERRCQEVLDRCWQDKNNPILFIHDVGAGGLSNAIPELVKDSGHGGLIDLRSIPNSEPGMTPMEIWCNESQERYVLAISEKNLGIFSDICERERCPYSIVGEITNGNNLEVYDSYFDNYPISLSLEILFGKPPKTHLSFIRESEELALLNLPKTVSNKLLYEVLRHPTVASKGFLITIGDRSITGLIARDQLVGPWQVPVSDYGLCKAAFSGKSGEAMAMGERTPLALLNASASAKIAVAEVVTNILPSGISNISDIKLSANWMGSPGKLQGNKDLFEAVEAIGMGLCPEWNMTIPVGKDSLSMSTEWSENDENKSVISPLSLIVSGFSTVKDISLAVTPELKNEKESVLLYIDLAKGKKRMGGSILSQIKGQTGGDAPDVECIKEMPLFVEAVYKLLSLKKILAYHDRSDGGLITTLCEMSFASRLGLSIDLDKIIEENHELISFLFNEELGVVIQVLSQDSDFVLEMFNETGLEDHIYNLGTISDQPSVDINYKSDLNSGSFSEILSESLSKDRFIQYTSKGVHRDDLNFTIDNNKIKNFGSQGQQKSFLIALKLAQFDYYKTKFGNSPIVLLDDIFDKLDQERVRQIVQILEKRDFGQIFITDTHIDRVKDALSESKNKEEIFDLEKLKNNE